MVFKDNLDKLETIKINNLDPNVEFGVTNFYDLSDDEFKRSHLMDNKFFNTEEVKPKSKIFVPEDFVSNQLFYRD